MYGKSVTLSTAKRCLHIHTDSSALSSNKTRDCNVYYIPPLNAAADWCHLWPHHTYIADWEELGHCVRVEIGAKEAAKKQFVLADNFNKVKHENGRLIAKRKFVTLEQLPESAKEVIEAVKAGAEGKEKRGTKLPDMQGTTLLDALKAITPQNIAAAAAGKKDKKKRKRSKSKAESEAKSEGEDGGKKGTGAPALAEEPAEAEGVKDTAGSGGEKKKRKKRSKKKKKKEEVEEEADVDVDSE